MISIGAQVVFSEHECPHGYAGVRADHIELETGTTIAFTTAPAMHWRDVPPSERAKVIHDATIHRVLEVCHTFRSDDPGPIPTEPQIREPRPFRGHR